MNNKRIYIAGPCAVESREQISSLAVLLKKAGATHLRGGAYKPRTSVKSFQGLGKIGIEYLMEAGKIAGIPVVTELVDISHLEYFRDVDIIQVGARNMQNFELLKQLGRCKKTILLKRGFGCTIDELLCSLDYIVSGGNTNIIICERGIRTFETCSRFTLDLLGAIYVKSKVEFPVIADPSHATGVAWMVPPIAKAILAAGLDGVMIEVHNAPEKALCDGKQSISTAKFEQLKIQLDKIKG